MKSCIDNLQVGDMISYLSVNSERDSWYVGSILNSDLNLINQSGKILLVSNLILLRCLGDKLTYDWKILKKR